MKQTNTFVSILKLNTYIVAIIITALIAVAALATFSTKTALAGDPTCTWTGAGVDNNWSTEANWTCDSGTLPTTGTILVFPNDAASSFGETVVNDLASSNVYSGINATQVDANSNSFSLDGNEIKLAGDITVSDGTYINLAGPLTLTADITVTGGAGIGVGGDNVVLAGYTLQFTGDQGRVGNAFGTGVIVYQDVGLGYLDENPGFTGLIEMYNSSIYASANSFGSDSQKTIVGTGSQLILSEGNMPSSVVTISEPFDFVGGYTDTNSVRGKLAIGYGPNDVGPLGLTNPVSATETYDNQSKRYEDDPLGYVLSGAISITSGDLRIDVRTPYIRLTGALSGAGSSIETVTKTSSYFGSSGNLIIEGSTNTTSTANSTISPTATVTTLSDSNTNSVYVGELNTVIVNGQRGDITVSDGGILAGSGTIGNVTLENGNLKPGNSPGVINTGNVSMDSSSTLDEEIAGTAAGEYDQLNVTGTVDLGSATLNTILFGGFVPTLNDTFTIINNDGSDAITGTFAGLAQGADIVVDDVTFTINYAGGTGNDVVLTVTATPGPPNTAGVLAEPVNMLIAAGVIASGLGLFAVQHALLKSRVAIKTTR